MRVNLSKACELLGKKPDTLKKWFTRGCPHEQKGSRYSLSIEAIFDWRVKYERSLLTQDNEGDETLLSLEVERAKLAREQRLKTEQDRLIKAAELLPRRGVVQVWAGIISELRTKVLNLPISDEQKAEIIENLRDVPVDRYID